MRRKDSTHTANHTSTSKSSTHPGIPGVPRLAKKPSEARQEQNRRAQQAFRERRRAKKQFSIRNTTVAPRLRQLALRPPPEVDVDLDQDVKVRCSDSAQSTSTQESPRPPSRCKSSSEQWCIDGEQGPPQARSWSTIERAPETPFTFPTAQTLFPAHKSLVPKRWTPREFLDLLRDPSTLALSPTPALPLWPHGVTATLAACLFNARALDIDLDRVMDPVYVSPFYRPSSGLISALPLAPSAAADEEAGASARFVALGPLRPCFAQAQVRAPREADPSARALDAVQELKRDVYVRQGVRFRGTGELRGGERVVCNEGGGRHCGHPWEAASWAVAPWFATKWKYLMDV
ncbi:hypothetical protein PV04_08834 [Phialophora macrospora]|uniref:BZIP domain-containing protein n=1 Tax=Phialophora macrospora TaxID=1851006 RepID=A0A0D2DNL7_9EURO|nr:hypothetical protein PV04_08834 [Phialophora macrospora]